MSEQDPNLSSRLEAVLLDKLARQDERIGMLEALLEDKRDKTESQKNISREHTTREEAFLENARPQMEPGKPSTRAMSFEAPARSVRAMSFETPVQPIRAMSFKTPDPAQPVIKTAPPLTAEREPIRLPEFNAPNVDAMAGLVQEKATARMRPVAAPDVSLQATAAQTPPAAEPDYERTARMNAASLRQRHSARKEPVNFGFRRAGSLALLSLAVAAMGVGLWQHRQSALISTSTADTRPMPLLTPPASLPAPHLSVASPAARSVKPSRSSRLFTGKPPILEPESEAPSRPMRARRVVARSAAALSGARSHFNSTAPQIASHSIASNGDQPCAANRTQAGRYRCHAQFQSNAYSAASLPASGGNAG